MTTPRVQFFLETNFPTAKNSYDYLYPVGAIRDNSRSLKFNHKLRNYPGSVLDLGCAGGGFIKDCVNEGRVAIGLEGTDFNKKEKKFEWATIPDNLFTCDITKPFTLHTGNKTPYQFNIITAWEFMEHIEKKDLHQIFVNIRNHLVNDGLVITSIDNHHYPHDKFKEIDLHRTVEERDWWLQEFRVNGFIEDNLVEDHFARDWVRRGSGFNLVFRKRMFNTPLCELAYKYGSDKCPQIRHHYTELYYELFKDKKDHIKKILEIGIGNQELMSWAMASGYTTGASLLMWRDFFPNAQIYGADIDSSQVFNDGRITTFLCDQTKKDDLIRLIEKTGSDLDLFIDDGSHKPEDQVFTCLMLMPILKKDVIYVIEDVGDLGIMEKLRDYDCLYEKFRNKSCWDDRMLIIRNKNV